MVPVGRKMGCNLPKLNLTQTEIKKIIPPESGRVDYFDAELKGFLLRVSADYLGGLKSEVQLL
jgi:hypothetical protein